MNTTKENHTHTHTLPGPGLDIPIFTKLYSFYKNLYSDLKYFPKDDHLLRQKINQISLDIFELLFKIPMLEKGQKLDTLQTISSKLDLLKILLRLGQENKDLTTKSYLILQSNLQEIGKMTGGWIRYLKSS